MIKEVDRRRSSRLVRFSNSCVNPDQPRSSLVPAGMNFASSASSFQTCKSPVPSPLRKSSAFPFDAMPHLKHMPVVLDETPEAGNPMDEVIVV
jgi:hypothetical protein